MKAIFLDRDGTINKMMYDNDRGMYSAKDMSEFELLPNAKEGIKKFIELGFMVIVITNQPGFTFGYLKDEEVDEINRYLKKLGVTEIYTCRHPEKDNCDCRKPKPKLLLDAAKAYDIDLSKSYMIGDNISDIQAGKVCKKTIFIGKARCDICNIMVERDAHPDFITKDLLEAAQIIAQE